MLTVSPALAGIADIYTSTSKSLYEFIQNKKCGDFTQDEVTCKICGPMTKSTTEGLSDVVENIYFRTAAEEEVRNLGCEISKIEMIRKNPDVVKKIKEDVLSN